MARRAPRPPTRVHEIVPDPASIDRARTLDDEQLANAVRQFALNPQHFTRESVSAYMVVIAERLVEASGFAAVFRAQRDELTEILAAAIPPHLKRQEPTNP